MFFVFMLALVGFLGLFVVVFSIIVVSVVKIVGVIGLVVAGVAVLVLGGGRGFFGVVIVSDDSSVDNDFLLFGVFDLIFDVFKFILLFLDVVLVFSLYDLGGFLCVSNSVVGFFGFIPLVL